MKTSATVLSLRELRKAGYTAEVVEKFNSFTKTRKDLFNLIDIIAIKPGEILGIQATTYGAASAHRKKIREEPLLQDWLKAGGFFQLHLWRKEGARYKVKVEMCIINTGEASKDS